MQYLVQLNIISEARPKSNEEGQVFYRNFIHPTLKKCQQLQDEGKILAGGPISGTIGLALIIKTESITDLDQLLAGLPVWPLMNTTVVPLTTFADRAASVETRFKNAQSENATNVASQI